MPRQISDQEYAFLQGKRGVADFVESIYNDPVLGKDAKALIKRKYPQVSIPDFDIENRLINHLSADRKQREEAEQKKATEAQDAKIKETREKVQKEYGFTDDAMKNH